MAFNKKLERRQPNDAYIKLQRRKMRFSGNWLVKVNFRGGGGSTKDLKVSMKEMQAHKPPIWNKTTIISSDLSENYDKSEWKSLDSDIESMRTLP